jgi:hypothetical protein
MNNLLADALSIIPRSTFQLKKFVSQSTNERGIVVPTYAAPVSVSGIVEAVKNTAYQALGLEFGKNYIRAWGEVSMAGIDTQEVADRIIYNGKTYTIINTTDWLLYNGWTSVIAVEDKHA